MVRLDYTHHYTYLLPFAPLLVMLFWAAIEDARSRKIRNWLTFSLIITGLIQSFMGSGGVTPLMSVAGLVVGFCLVVGLFILGAVGGGDVKLLAGVGAWVGAIAVFKIFCVEAVIGMIIVLIQAGYSGRLRVLLRNSALLAVNIVNIKQVGLAHTTHTGQACRSIDRPLPYAVPVLLAVLTLIALGAL